MQHLAAGKATYRLSVNLPLDESFGSCLMPSRADINVDTCQLDELTPRCHHLSQKLTNTAVSSTMSATEVELHTVVFDTKHKHVFVSYDDTFHSVHLCDMT